MQIQKEKEMYDKMCKLDRTRYFLIVGGVLLAASIILLNLYLLLRNARAKKVKLENELTVNRNHLAATQLVTTTKSQLIDSMITAVKEMKNKGTMSTNDANSLLSSLKTHISAKDELDSFIRIHETLHPKFAMTLGERCPGIPESMIRLASYVAMGYTTQQIAEMLSIGHATVNKNRYRLRTRLGLARNESLEHYLRTLYAEEDSLTK